MAAAGVVVFGWLARRARADRALRLVERAVREEFEAYARLDAAPGTGEEPQAFARRVSAAVAHHSSFSEAALLLRDAGQRLQVAGSAGMDDLMLAALDAWGERYAREQRMHLNAGVRRSSYVVTLGPLEAFDPTHHMLRDNGMPPAPIGCRQALMLPLCTQAGDTLGVIAVCASGKQVPREIDTPALEALATKLAHSVENAALNEKLRRAERQAGLGQLARGVAHELNNPLTAILGFAELIADTACASGLGKEALRVRDDARSIVTQALRMKETVESLVQFWRPSSGTERAIDLSGMLHELAMRCRPELERRGIKLVVQCDEEAPMVRAQRDRLLDVFERLLNNAAQAIADYAKKNDSTNTSATIRMALTVSGAAVQVIVSDTGGGFVDPARVFDPFYTTRQPGAGSGMGLAVSYGVIREHGGEVSAFNLRPHGAAVVVELPLARTVRESGQHATVASSAM